MHSIQWLFYLVGGGISSLTMYDVRPTMARLRSGQLSLAELFCVQLICVSGGAHVGACGSRFSVG